MSFEFNPHSKVGSYSQGVIGQSVIIGLPSMASAIPNYVIGTTTTENANISSSIVGLPITDGDLIQKAARNSGTYTLKLILSETPNTSSQQIAKVSKAVQQISNVARTLLNPSPSFVPNLSGISSSFIVTQLTALRNMKDFFQPILALNLFMPISSFSVGNNNLNSFWYIEKISFDKEEAARGVIVNLSLKEVVERRSFSSVSQTLMNLATEILN
jgi:hypothetical protein